MKKAVLFRTLILGAFLSCSGWSSSQNTDTADLLGDIEVLKQKVYNATSKNAELEKTLERARLLEQLRIEEEKTKSLEAEKAKLEEDANLPKTWEDIPWNIMHTAWVNNYSTIESIFDPRKSSNSLVKESSKLLAKNGGKKFKPAISQINSSHTDVLKKHPNQWASLGLNEDTETHTNIARFLLDKIWLQAYQGKVGFTI